MVSIRPRKALGLLNHLQIKKGVWFSRLLLFLLFHLTRQKLFQCRLADAVGVAHLLGFQALVVDRGKDVFL